MVESKELRGAVAVVMVIIVTWRLAGGWKAGEGISWFGSRRVRGGGGSVGVIMMTVEVDQLMAEWIRLGRNGVNGFVSIDNNLMKIEGVIKCGHHNYRNRQMMFQ